MDRMKALGINWNNLDPFPRYGPLDFPAVAPAAAPSYLFPVVQGTPPVVTTPAPAPAASDIPSWVLFGGAALAGVVLASLLLKKS